MRCSAGSRKTDAAWLAELARSQLCIYIFSLIIFRSISVLWYWCSIALERLYVVVFTGMSMSTGATRLSTSAHWSFSQSCFAVQYISWNLSPLPSLFVEMPWGLVLSPLTINTADLCSPCCSTECQVVICITGWYSEIYRWRYLGSGSIASLLVYWTLFDGCPRRNVKHPSWVVGRRLIGGGLPNLETAPWYIEALLFSRLLGKLLLLVSRIWVWWA